MLSLSYTNYSSVLINKDTLKRDIRGYSLCKRVYKEYPVYLLVPSWIFSSFFLQCSYSFKCIVAEIVEILKRKILFYQNVCIMEICLCGSLEQLSFSCFTAISLPTKMWLSYPESSRSRLLWEIKITRVFWTFQKKVSKIPSPIH